MTELNSYNFLTITVSWNYTYIMFDSVHCLVCVWETGHITISWWRRGGDSEPSCLASFDVVFSRLVSR
jgi:hypothetical protein